MIVHVSVHPRGRICERSGLMIDTKLSTRGNALPPTLPANRSERVRTTEMNRSCTCICREESDHGGSGAEGERGNVDTHSSTDPTTRIVIDLLNFHHISSALRGRVCESALGIAG